MSILSKLIDPFDFLLVKTVSSEIKQREKLYDKEFPADSINDDYAAYDAIDARATSVLQHVSIMIAVTGVLFSKATGWISHAFGFELLVYILLALLCIRLLVEDQLSEDFLRRTDIVAKEAVLAMVSKLAFLITIPLLATVIAEVAKEMVSK